MSVSAHCLPQGWITNQEKWATPQEPPGCLCENTSTFKQGRIYGGGMGWQLPPLKTCLASPALDDRIRKYMKDFIPIK